MDSWDIVLSFDPENSGPYVLLNMYDEMGKRAEVFRVMSCGGARIAGASEPATCAEPRNTQRTWKDRIVSYFQSLILGAIGSDSV